MVNSWDVARAAGVSQTTVSRVLRNSETVRPETRAKVLAALAKLDYAPSAAARAMRTRRTDAIGVLAHEITNPFFPELLDAISRSCRERGLKTILWNQDDSDREGFMDQLAQGLVDGLCVTSASRDMSATIVEMQKRIPVVLVNRGLSDVSVDQVTSDNTGAARTAARYIVSAGRREVAAIFGDVSIETGPERERGFTGELRRSGISILAERISRGPSSFETGYAGMRSILTGPTQPDTVFCNNDVIAYGALSALRAAGLRVPEDVWVLGIDGLAMSGWEVFDLTTVRQPIVDMAEQAVALLQSRVAGDVSPPVIKRLGTELVVRKTTAAFKVV